MYWTIADTYLFSFGICGTFREFEAGDLVTFGDPIIVQKYRKLAMQYIWYTDI